jgi:ATP-dependent DNA helicase RecG
MACNCDVIADEVSPQIAVDLYEQQPCPQTSYKELSKELLRILFTRCDRSTLIGAGYASNGVSGRTIPNVAGTLLFYPEHQRIIPESGIVVSVYADKDKQHLSKKQEFSEGIIPMLEESFAFISTLLGTHYERKGLIKHPRKSRFSQIGSSS